MHAVISGEGQIQALLEVSDKEFDKVCNICAVYLYVCCGFYRMWFCFAFSGSSPLSTPLNQLCISLREVGIPSSLPFSPFLFPTIFSFPFHSFVCHFTFSFFVRIRRTLVSQSVWYKSWEKYVYYTHTPTHSHTHIHTHIHIHSHTHTHSHTHSHSHTIICHPCHSHMCTQNTGTHPSTQILVKIIMI